MIGRIIYIYFLNDYFDFLLYIYVDFWYIILIYLFWIKN